MSISVNGQSCVPPGFRFHPTEEELLNYYLKKKIASERIDLEVIRDVDLNKLEPWDIQEKCKIGSTPQNDWYFFSHKDKKYPTGTRTNRATAAGFWKATGRDKVIYASFSRIGMRKTLVFYKGRAPHGQKSDWIMHEYRLDDRAEYSNGGCSIGVENSSSQEEGWVVCRVFKKKSHHHHHKSSHSPNHYSSIAGDMMLSSPSDGTLDEILKYMGRSCKQESENSAFINNSHNNHMRYLKPFEAMKLPPLESPTQEAPAAEDNSCQFDGMSTNHEVYHGELRDWATFDRLVASHLNGEDPGFGTFSSSSGQLIASCSDVYNGGGGGGDEDGDLWSLTRSTSDHIGL